jgi:hypothetical protein
MRMYLTLLQTYAEHQLSRLPASSCLQLYNCIYEILNVFQRKFAARIAQRSRSEEMVAEEEAYRNESCLHLLKLLNELSSSEFSFSEDCAVQTNVSFERQIATVLLHGMKIITPLLPVDFLRQYAATAERFLSFLAFMTTSYTIDIVRWVNSLGVEEGNSALHSLLERLFCASGFVDAYTARLALQVRAITFCFNCFLLCAAWTNARYVPRP